MPSRSTTPALARIALFAALAVALGACDLVREVGARSWTLASTNQAGTEHTIAVTDRSGLVADVAFAPPDANLFEPVTAVPGDPASLVVAWTGGACDETTAVEVTKAGPNLAVAVAIEDNGQPCDSLGLPQAVRLIFAEPLDPAMVKVTQ
jgi:hypothetical protein